MGFLFLDGLVFHVGRVYIYIHIIIYIWYYNYIIRIFNSLFKDSFKFKGSFKFRGFL